MNASRLFCGCNPLTHHAKGLCRSAYDRYRRSGTPTPCGGLPSHESPSEAPQGRIEMCGCRFPLVGLSGCICQRCSLENLAALLQARPPRVMPAIIQAAVEGGRARLI